MAIPRLVEEMTEAFGTVYEELYGHPPPTPPPEEPAPSDFETKYVSFFDRVYYRLVRIFIIILLPIVTLIKSLLSAMKITWRLFDL